MSRSRWTWPFNHLRRTAKSNGKEFGRTTMEALATLGIVIALMVGLGKFLDTRHLELATIDKIRNRLISFYFWLYDAPLRLRARCKAFIDWFDRLHEPPPFDIKTGELIEQPRPWARYGLQVLGAVSAPLALMQFHHFDPDQGVSPMNMPRETAWWWAILFGAVFGVFGPFFLIFMAAFWGLLITLPSLSLLAAVEIIRRSSMVVLNKSTSPRTSPFAYLSGLASIVLATVEALHKLVELWWVAWPTFD